MISLVVTDYCGLVVAGTELPLGWRQAQPGRPLAELLHPDDFAPGLIRALASGQVDRLRLECRVVTGEGRLRQALCFGSRVDIDPGYLLFAIEDVTPQSGPAAVSAGPQPRSGSEGSPHLALVSGAGRAAASEVIRVRVRPPSDPAASGPPSGPPARRPLEELVASRLLAPAGTSGDRSRG